MHPAQAGGFPGYGPILRLAFNPDKRVAGHSAEVILHMSLLRSMRWKGFLRGTTWM